MEGGTYTTLIPVHTLALGREAGTSILFGFDYQEIMPDAVGVIPVQVAEPMGTAYTPDMVMDRWRQCFQWLFLTSPPEDDLLDLGGFLRNSDVGNNIKEAVNQSEKMYMTRAKLGLSTWHEVFCNFLVGLRVIPRRVVSSPCQGCAQDGGWTMTLSWALWHPEEKGLFNRWNPVMPSKPESAAAQSTHDLDVIEIASNVWDEVREMYVDYVPGAQHMTYQQVAEQDEDGALMQEVEEEAEKRWRTTVNEAHSALWFPPDWLIETFSDRLTQEGHAVTESIPLVSRLLKIGCLDDPYSSWEQGLQSEHDGRRNYAS